MPDALTFDDLIGEAKAPQPVKFDDLTAVNFDDLAKPTELQAWQGEHPEETSQHGVWVRPRKTGFFENLAWGAGKPLSDMLGGVEELAASDERLKSMLQDELTHQKMEQPTTAGRVGETIGGLAGQVLLSAGLHGAKVPLAGPVQFGLQGQQNAFLSAGIKALQEGRTFDEAVQIGKSAAHVGGAAQALVGLIPGGKALPKGVLEAWPEVVKTAFKFGPGMSAAQAAENIAQQQLGLKTSTTEGVLEAGAMGAAFPVGARALRGLARRIALSRYKAPVTTEPPPTPPPDGGDGEAGAVEPSAAPTPPSNLGRPRIRLSQFDQTPSESPQFKTEKDRERALLRGLIDADTSDESTGEAFQKVGYVKIDGFWVHPDVDPEWVQQLSDETKSKLREKGIFYLDNEIGSGVSGRVQKLQHGDRLLRGIGVKSSRELGAKLYTNKDLVALHEVGHHVWQDELSEEQRADWTSRPRVTEHGKKVENGETAVDYPKTDAAEEDFAQHYAENGGDLNKTLERTSNAIPITKTEILPVLPTPSDSQTVAQGVRPAEGTPGVLPVPPEAPKPEPIRQVAPEPPPTTTAFDPSKVATVELPVNKLKLSKDVPNFKADANEETGTVRGQELSGKYVRTGTAPIVVWERANGDLEVITGRHRLDLAKRSGELTIPSQVVSEKTGFTKEMALTLDAEANIRDGQGEVSDYATYFKGTNVDEFEARARGLLSRAKGKAGWSLAKAATDDVYALWRSGKITTEAAIAIAQIAPGDAAAQRIGSKAALAGKSPEIIAEMIKAARATSGGQPAQLDLLGADDSAMKNMEAMAERAQSIQRDIREQIAAASGASKRPEIAAKLGVDVKNPVAVASKLNELRGELNRWADWPLHPDLVAKVKGEPPPKQPPSQNLFGPPESVEEQKARLSAEAKAKAEKEAKAGMAGKAAAPLVGSTGDIGQTDLAGGGDLFSKSPAEKPSGILASLEASMTPEERAELDSLTNDLNKKLGDTRILVDPEYITKGGRIAMLYAKAGIRKFRDFAKVMLEKFGEKAKPYLLSWYNNVRTALGGAGFDNEFDAQLIYDTEINADQTFAASGVAGGIEGGRTVPGATGSEGGRRSPVARVVRKELIPQPGEYVRASSYAAKSGFTLDEDQTLGVNQVLSHFLDRKGPAFMLADGTGFGKSAQLVVAADQFKKANPQAKILYVTQNAQMIKGSVTGDAGKMGIDLKQFTISTYGKLHTLTEHKWDLIIFDEAQNLKNGDARKSMAAARLEATHTLFATATPMDRPSGAAYFLAAITGKDEMTVAKELGYTFQERIDPYTQKPYQVAVLLPKTNWAMVWANITAYRDAAIRGGGMLRREYPFYGNITVSELAMDFNAKMEHERILKHYDTLIDNASTPTARRNYAGQKTLTLRRWSEQKKVQPAFDEAIEHLKGGGQVIIMAETDKDQSFPQPVPGGVRGENDKGFPVWRVPGAISKLTALFDQAGIEVAHIHDTTKYDVASEVDKFQTGKAKVALATPASGGAGINLDDVVGNAPRKLIVLSKNLAGDAWDQVIGRVSRKTTQSEAKVNVYHMPDSFGDQRGDDILQQKVRTLRAIQGGEDLDTAGGFTPDEGDRIQSKPSDIANAIADKLQGLKSPQKNVQLFGVIPAVWNAAIDLATGIVRAGGKVADAVAKAIEYIKANHTGAWDEAKARVAIEHAAQPGVETQMQGAKFKVRSATQSSVDKPAGVAAAIDAFQQVGLRPTIGHDGRVWLDDGDGWPPRQAEGVKLLKATSDAAHEMFSGRLAQKDSPANDRNVAFLDSVRHIGERMQSMIDRGEETAFDQPLVEQLLAVAQGAPSELARMLQLFDSGQRDFRTGLRNVDVELRRELDSRFGADGAVRQVLMDAMTHFREFFTDAEIANMTAKDTPLEQFFAELLRRTAQDRGSYVYRMSQARMKPQIAKTLKYLEADTIRKEAVQQILQNFVEAGGKLPEKKTAKLTPHQQLMLLAQPETVAKLDDAIAKAVRQGQRKAAREIIVRDDALTAEELFDYDERTKDADHIGPDPTEQQIDAGLELPTYAHWRVIQDNLLGYSPVTDAMIRKVIAGDFKGTKFEKGATPPKLVKIDLVALAKSPEAEVQRVIDAHAANLEAELGKATPWMQQRILTMIRQGVMEQIERTRRDLRDPKFAPPKDKATALTPDQQMAQAINTKLFADPRLDVPAMVERLASKSLLQKFTPNLTEMVTKLLDTPFFKHDALAQKFADQLVDQFGIDPAQREKARLVFATAFKQKAGAAAVRAAEKARDALTPRQREAFPQGKLLWKKLIEMVNAKGFDTVDTLRAVAEANHWNVTDATLAEMRALGEREQRLEKELPDATLERMGLTREQISEYDTTGKGLTPEQAADLEDRRVLQREGTDTERNEIHHKMVALWARMTRPIGVGTHEARRNATRMANDLSVINILTRWTFGTIQAIDVLTQSLAHTITAASSHAGLRYKNLPTNEKGVLPWLTEQGEAIKQSLSLARSTYGSGFSALWQGLSEGRGLPQRVESVETGMHTFDRAAAKASELMKSQDPAQKIRGTLLWISTEFLFGRRVTAALDQAQTMPGRTIEWGAMLRTYLRTERGFTKAQAETMAGDITGDIKAELALAATRAPQVLADNGIKATKAGLNIAAWNMVFGRMLERAKAMGFSEGEVAQLQSRINKRLQTLSWNRPEKSWIGKVSAQPLKAVEEAFTNVYLPTAPMSSFGNALALGAVQKMQYSPLGFLVKAGFFEGSPTAETALDKGQIMAKATFGTAIGTGLAALAATGLIKLILSWPDDPKERAEMAAKHLKPGMALIPLGDGRYFTTSITAGPLALVSPELVAGAAIYQVNEKKAKQQEKMNAEAAKKGLAPGKVEGWTARDVLHVAGQVAKDLLNSTRTASGKVGSLTDYGEIISNKALAGWISTKIPLLPLFQNTMQIAGVDIDPRMAGAFWDMILPLPSSGARRVNALGERVSDSRDLSDVLAMFTRGTGKIGQERPDTSQAYANLLASGFNVPAVQAGKSFNVNGQFRPLNDNELARYTETRGKLFKAALGGATSKEDVAADFAQSDQTALEAVGAAKANVPRATTGAGGAGAAPNRSRTGASRFSRFSRRGRGVTGGLSRFRGSPSRGLGRRSTGLGRRRALV